MILDGHGTVPSGPDWVSQGDPPLHSPRCFLHPPLLSASAPLLRFVFVRAESTPQDRSVDALVLGTSTDWVVFQWPGAVV